MPVILSDEEKQILTEMVRIDRAAPAGQDKSFYLIPRSYSDPLPTLAHAAMPWRTEIQEGVVLALSEAGLVRRVKLDAGMPWFEVTEAGRQYADKLRSGDTETAARQVAERHENRLKFIKRLYEATGGSIEKSAAVNAFEIGKALGVPDEATRAIIRYLLDQKLIDSPFGASQFTLTHRGLVETEEAILNPGQATEHFPAINPVHVHEAPGSQIQHAPSDSGVEWQAIVQALSSDEKSMFAEMADIDRSTPSGQDRSFYLIPRSYTDPLPTLAHAVLPWRTEVSDDSMSVLTSAGLLRRVKLNADMPWFEVTEAGRQCARHLATMSSHTPADEKRQQLRAFLCHSSGDKVQIRNLYEMLKADGIAPWLDEKELLGGQDWDAEIRQAIKDTDIILVCLSATSITKAGYVQKEIKFALDRADEQPERTILIIPLRLEECTVPDRFTKWQWIDMYEADGYERLLRTLRVKAKSLGRVEPYS